MDGLALMAAAIVQDDNISLGVRGDEDPLEIEGKGLTVGASMNHGA